MTLNAIGAVFTVLIIVAVGYFVGRLGWANQSVTDFITKLIVKVSLPCMALAFFLDYFDADMLGASWIYIAVSAAALGAVYGISKIVVRVAKIDRRRRGVFTALFSYSNSIFIGLPVATAIFGGAGALIALFYYIGNTVFANSLGYAEIAGDGACMAEGGGRKVSAKAVLGRIFQPPILAVIAGLVLVVLNVQLPDFVMSAVRYTGNITSPLALVFIGIILQRTGLSCIRQMDRDMALVCVGRFVVAPLVMLGLCALAGVARFPTQVLTVQIGLPALTQTAIFAELCRADSAYATKGVVITTLISFATIPIWVALIT